MNSKPIEMYTREEVESSMPYVKKNLELSQEIYDATAERLGLIKGLPADAFMPLNPQFSFETNRDFAANSQRKQIATMEAELNSIQTKIDASADYITQLQNRLEDLDKDE